MGLPARTWLTTALLFVVLARQYTAQTTGSDCGAILRAGVYDTISKSTASSSFAEFQSSICTDVSSTSYNEYLESIKTFNENEQSRSKVKAIAAGGSYAGYGASYGSSSGTQDSSHTLTANEFETAKKTATSYRSSGCNNQSSKNDMKDNLVTLQQTINPRVYASYESCLNLFLAGVRITETGGLDKRSVAITMQFKPDSQGAIASLEGLNITTSFAECSMLGGDLTPEAAANFKTALVPNRVYTIFCKLKDDAPEDAKFTEIFISTTPGGVYKATLFHNIGASQVVDLQQQIRGAQNNLNVSISAVQDAFNLFKADTSTTLTGLKSLPLHQGSFCTISNGGACPPAMVSGTWQANIQTDGCGWTTGNVGDSYIRSAGGVNRQECGQSASKNFVVFVCCYKQP